MVGKQRELAPIGPFNPKPLFLIDDTAVHESRLRGPGLLGGMRVSKVARYTKSFSPTRNWASDDDTVMLFDFSRPEGRPQDAHVPDLSSKGNHGELIDVFESVRAE